MGADSERKQSALNGEGEKVNGRKERIKFDFGITGT
jgi:hypothetical protein